jgi:hypothetical protein
MSVLCHERHFTPQQTLSLFDHFVGTGEQRGGTVEARCLSGLDYCVAPFASVRYAFALWHQSRSGDMSDPKKTEEISRKIQEISRSVQSHESNVNRIEREKNDKTRYYDQQITRERDEIKRLNRQIEDLKRQL